MRRLALTQGLTLIGLLSCRWFSCLELLRATKTKRYSYLFCGLLLGLFFFFFFWMASGVLWRFWTDSCLKVVEKWEPSSRATAASQTFLRCQKHVRQKKVPSIVMQSLDFDGCRLTILDLDSCDCYGGNAFVSFMSHTIGDVEVMDSIVPFYRCYEMIYVFISQLSTIMARCIFGTIT